MRKISTHRLHFVLLALALALAACVTHPPTTAPVSGAPTLPADLHGARVYEVSPAASSVHILVYRGGTLGNLGHNHVMSCVAVKGYVWQHERLTQSGFDIAVPVNDLIVDDNAARAAEGTDFPVNVPDNAKQGTKHNMLSAVLLDGEHYPYITLRSVSISGTASAPQITVRMTIKNHTHEYKLPVSVESKAQQLHVRGEFELKQTDFDIKPYSVAMGALQVQDVVKIKFDLLALAQ